MIVLPAELDLRRQGAAVATQNLESVPLRRRRRAAGGQPANRASGICGGSHVVADESTACQPPRPNLRDAIAASSFSCSHGSTSCAGRNQASARFAWPSEPWFSAAMMALACET